MCRGIVRPTLVCTRHEYTITTTDQYAWVYERGIQTKDDSFCVRVHTFTSPT